MSTDYAHKGYNKSSMKPLHHKCKNLIPHYPIQCKILFGNCAGQQVLGTFVKLVSEALLPDAYTVLTEWVRELQGDSFVGIKICNSI